MTPEQQKAIAIASARKRMAEANGGQQEQPSQAVSGSILPFSKDEHGNVSFDSNAGVLGSIKRAFTLPGEVYAGHIDPMTNEGRSRAMEMATVFSPVSGAMKAGERAIPGIAKSMVKETPTPPTAEQLLKTGSEGFDAMRQTGATYPSSAVKQLSEVMQTGMNTKGFDEITAPQTFQKLKMLAAPPNESVATIANLHSARKSFGKIGQNFNNPADQSAAAQAINGLDRFIAAQAKIGGADDATAAARSQAAKLLDESNANYSAGKRSNLIGGIDESANLRAAAANSGTNLGNTIRSKVASALESPKKISGFDKNEVAMLEGIIRGSKPANATRKIANYLGGGGGLGALSSSAVGAGAGSLVAGPAGAAVGAAAAPLAGAGMKVVSNALTESALKAADAAIRSRSPLYQQMVKYAEKTPIPQSKRAALVRVLTAQAIQGQSAE